ncbi:hypothetical protein ORJ04_03490 [Rheinheimera baltica]|uniref:Orphan protein n=1 Tax=Rheinheimera baltica TaxID=67576 RepID=A0ABT9HV58_9GAMM|nr:hypothetical protein [Rheinheimera baltica]MDP5135010.1 hypothetical protein [Rheinheimera baltica]
MHGHFARILSVSSVLAGLARIWLCCIHIILLAHETNMPIDPIVFICLIKQFRAEDASCQILLNWLSQATLLQCQTAGNAVFESLITQLTNDFAVVMQAVATLDNHAENHDICQTLLTQLSQFYTWLATLSGNSTQHLEQQWQDSWANSSTCAATCGEGAVIQQVTACGTETTTHKVRLSDATSIVPPRTVAFNKYD